MPWRREEVAPYTWDFRYHPDTHARTFYSWHRRSDAEMEEARKKAYELNRQERYRNSPRPRFPFPSGVD